MGAATQDYYGLDQIGLSRLSMLVAASMIIYRGTLVATNATGYLVPCSDAANLNFFGFAESSADNSGGINGAAAVVVTPVAAGRLGVMELNAVSPDLTWIGQILAAKDDNTAELMIQSTHVLRLGRCIAVTKTGTSGRVWVDTSDREATNIFSS